MWSQRWTSILVSVVYYTLTVLYYLPVQFSSYSSGLICQTPLHLCSTSLDVVMVSVDIVIPDAWFLHTHISGFMIVFFSVLCYSVVLVCLESSPVLPRVHPCNPLVNLIFFPSMLLTCNITFHVLNVEILYSAWHSIIFNLFLFSLVCCTNVSVMKMQCKMYSVCLHDFSLHKVVVVVIVLCSYYYINGLSTCIL